MRNLKMKFKRIELNMSQTEPARRTGVPRQTIGLIEAGEFNPSIKPCISCIRAGIWDRRLDMKPRTCFIVSLIAALCTAVFGFVQKMATWAMDGHNGARRMTDLRKNVDTKVRGGIIVQTENESRHIVFRKRLRKSMRAIYETGGKMMYRKSKDGKRGKALIRRMAVLALCGTMFFSNGMVTLAAGMEDVFDTQAYADQYPDLKAAFGDDEKALLNHYLTYGIQEGRESFGLLDVVKYREMYPDLAAAFGDDWDAYVEHYLTYGALEGRETGTDFNALDYAERYPDLKAAFGDDVLALYKHYQTCGKTENREARSEKVVQEEIRQKQARQSAARQSASSNGSRTEREDYDGGYTIYEYDAAGNQVKSTTYSADDVLINYTISERDAAGLLMKWTKYLPDDTVYEYTIFEHDAAHLLKSNSYNRDGEPTGMWEATYDAAGKLIKTVSQGRVYENGKESGWSELVEDADGRIVSSKLYDNQWNVKYEREYNADGSSKEIDYDANGYKFIEIDYTADGRSSEKFYNNGVIYSWKIYNTDGSYKKIEYDANGDPISEREYNSDDTLK